MDGALWVNERVKHTAEIKHFHTSIVKKVSDVVVKSSQVDTYLGVAAKLRERWV